LGSLYRPTLKFGRPSLVWWAKYYVNGRPMRESTGVSADTKTPPADAKQFLKECEGRVAMGHPMLPRADGVRYEEAAADLRRYYATTGSRDLTEAEGRPKRLDAFFAGRRLASIGHADVPRYAEQRQAEGASNATINRELAVLGRMMRVAYEASKLFRLPVLRKLKEAGPRQDSSSASSFSRCDVIFKQICNSP